MQCFGVAPSGIAFALISNCSCTALALLWRCPRSAFTLLLTLLWHCSGIALPLFFAMLLHCFAAFALPWHLFCFALALLWHCCWPHCIAFAIPSALLRNCWLPWCIFFDWGFKLPFKQWSKSEFQNFKACAKSFCVVCGGAADEQPFGLPFLNNYILRALI